MLHRPAAPCGVTPAQSRALDAVRAQVAVGRSHAGLLTHGGELYTWGSGGGARLGHGHAGPAATPQRVHTLWAAAATAIKCSDSASAVISQVGQGGNCRLVAAAVRTWKEGVRRRPWLARLLPEIGDSPCRVRSVGPPAPGCSVADPKEPRCLEHPWQRAA